MKILFMCVANSARSQMAEGLARKLFGRDVEIASAGSEPKVVNPLAIKVMGEIGIDISSHRAKSFDKLAPDFTGNLDFVITLCAEEVCPVLATKSAKRLHWPLIDPAVSHGSEGEQLSGFRRVRDQIQERLEAFGADLNGR